MYVAQGADYKIQANNFAVKMLFSTLTVLILIEIKGAKLE